MKINTVSHGAYYAETVFDIEQLKYAGGHGGFIEVLEIKNPPPKHPRYVLYDYWAGSRRVCEFAELEPALNAWQKLFSYPGEKPAFGRTPGLTGCYTCQKDSPWFYRLDLPDFSREQEHKAHYNSTELDMLTSKMRDYFKTFYWTKVEQGKYYFEVQGNPKDKIDELMKELEKLRDFEAIGGLDEAAKKNPEAFRSPNYDVLGSQL